MRHQVVRRGQGPPAPLALVKHLVLGGSPAGIVVQDVLQGVPEEDLGLAHALRGEAELEHLELDVAGVLQMETRDSFCPFRSLQNALSYQVVIHGLVQLELGQEPLVRVDALPLRLDLLERLLQAPPVLLHDVGDDDRSAPALAAEAVDQDVAASADPLVDEGHRRGHVREDVLVLEVRHVQVEVLDAGQRRGDFPVERGTYCKTKKH